MDYVRGAALNDEACPKCGAVNPNDRQVTIWRVADERGLHFQCDSCGHAWRLPVERIEMTARQQMNLARALNAGRDAE